MLLCPDCKAVALRRTPRSLSERLRGSAAAYVCQACHHRHAVAKVKHCWRCGTDLDRRKRQTAIDFAAAVMLLWPYSCRRCGVRRYRWGKRGG